MAEIMEEKLHWVDEYEKTFNLKGLISLRGIAYASQSLCPNNHLMQNYNFTQLELLVLKWAVTEKLSNYLLGPKFTVYTDNNPLPYV